MKFKDIIIQNLLMILFGITILFLDHIEFNDSNNKLLILVFCLIKSGYFLMTGFKKLVNLSSTDIRYHQFLLYLALTISFIVMSFAIDYFCLLYIDPVSLSGIPNHLSYLEKAFKVFYFSVLIFSNIGAADILPGNLASEFLMMVESILSFITIIFVLSDFISLKESLSGFKNRRTMK
jgi:hypothetical protein